MAAEQSRNGGCVSEENSATLSTESRHVQSLLSWLQTRGGHVHDGVDFVYGIASNDIAADVVIVSLPVEACITTPQAKAWVQSLVISSNEKGATRLNDKDWIILYLVLHKIALEGAGKRQETSAKGQAADSVQTDAPAPDVARPQKRTRYVQDNEPSFATLAHREYVRLLPSEVITPLHYRRAELDLLKNTPLCAHAARRRKQTRQACRRGAAWLGRHKEHLEPAWRKLVSDYLGSGAGSDTFYISENRDEDFRASDIERELAEWNADEENFKLLPIWRWAETAHGSRAFPPHLIGVHGAPVLLPVYDLFNHSRNARVTWTHESGCDAHHGQHSPRNDDAETLARAPSVTLTIHDRVLAGQQVYNSYGPKSNEELLASYGFVNEGLDDDAVTLRLASDESGHKGPDGSEAKKDSNSAAQHYWKYGQGCPEALIAEILAHLDKQGIHPLDEDEQQNGHSGDFGHVQGEVRSRLRQLMDRAQAFAMVVELLEHKLAMFSQSQVGYDGVVEMNASVTDRTAIPSEIRPTVLHGIGVYRQGQSRILQWALRSAQTDEEDLSCQIEGILDPP